MIKIIPAIDIIEGKCVRLSQGDYNNKKVYNENPLEVAKMFEDIGIKRLHLVDLDGAKAGKIINYKTLESIATSTSLDIDFGGGVQSNEDIAKAFDYGAKMITGGSIAIKNPSLLESWIHQYSGDKIILGADCKNEMIAIAGWTSETQVNIIDFIKSYSTKGITKVICTDIAKDGMLKGPSLNLYKKILKHFPSLVLIASGGVSCMQDILDLNQSGVTEVIVGKAIYENKITMDELRKFLAKN